MQQTVEKNVFNIFPCCRRGNQGNQEFASVIVGQLDKDPDYAVHAVTKNENHSQKEREDERMKSVAETIYYHSTPSTLS